jgi:hypothetical protein
LRTPFGAPLPVKKTPKTPVLAVNECEFSSNQFFEMAIFSETLNKLFGDRAAIAEIYILKNSKKIKKIKKQKIEKITKIKKKNTLM